MKSALKQLQLETMPRLLVIGGGIGAWAFIRALDESPVGNTFDEIHQVEAPALAPSCSVSSTAVAALRGTRAGLSALGDELVADWEVARSQLARLEGVVAGHLTTACWSERDERRFSHLATSMAPPLDLKSSPALLAREEAYIIAPSRALASVRGACARVRTTQSLVTGVEALSEGIEVRLLGDQRLRYDQVVVCAGAWESWLATSAAPLTRAVRGSYAHWDNVDYGRESFAFTIDGTNLVYRAEELVFLLGASSEKEEGRLWPDAAAVEQRWRSTQERLAVELPPWDQARLHTGLRQVGPQRRPYIQSPAERVLFAGGLYKNGWISAWGQAQRLVARLSAGHASTG